MPRIKMFSHTLTALVLLALTACARLPAERGIPDVHQLVAQRSGQQLGAPHAETETLVKKLLSATLTADQAVHLALLNNPRVRAEYARLGIAAAEVYDAGRLSNPRLTLDRLASNVSGQANQAGVGLVQSFTDLLLLPARGRLAAGEFERAKAQAGFALLELAADVEVAYCNLVGSQQVASLRRAVADTAQNSATLAQRFVDAGNLTTQAWAQQTADAAAAADNAMQADTEVQNARGVLNELLGLAPNTRDWQTVAELPTPPNNDAQVEALITLALKSRLDLVAQRREVLLLTDALGTARSLRYLGAVEVGVLSERQTDRARLTGPTLSLELPLFNQGAGKSARALASLELAQSALASLELAVANQVQTQAQRAAAARRRAEQLRSQLIPAREEVLKRAQQEVDYMLEGPFHLLTVKQQTFAAYQAYIEAVRDYWLARAELGRAVGTSVPPSVDAITSTAPIKLPVAEPVTTHHAQHPGGAQ